jgi:maleylpyruvate isomerase
MATMTSTGTADRLVALDLLDGAAARVNRTVDGLLDPEWRGPSLLPGWSRAHVVAHLALNAEALAGALHGVVSGEPAPMYASDDRRDTDIDDVASARPSEIRNRLLGATTALHDAFAALPEEAWDQRVDRTPGGRSMRAASLPSMRVRELEIHHVDLDAGYTRAQWSAGLTELLLDAMAKRVSEQSFEVKPLGSTRTWVFGTPEAEYPVPVVTGPAADIGWWLTGRPAPETLSCSRGALPEIGAW